MLFFYVQQIVPVDVKLRYWKCYLPLKALNRQHLTDSYCEEATGSVVGFVTAEKKTDNEYLIETSLHRKIQTFPHVS